MLCLATKQASGALTVNTAIKPSKGAITYLTADGTPDDSLVWGAVAPGVAKLVINIPNVSDPFYFTVNGVITAQNHRLQDLGNGWHSFDLPFTYQGDITVLASAYATDGKLLAARQIGPGAAAADLLPSTTVSSNVTAAPCVGGGTTRVAIEFAGTGGLRGTVAFYADLQGTIVPHTICANIENDNQMGFTSGNQMTTSTGPISFLNYLQTQGRTWVYGAVLPSVASLIIHIPGHASLTITTPAASAAHLSNLSLFAAAIPVGFVPDTASAFDPQSRALGVRNFPSRP